MPNIATVLKAEISRLARKETREESDRLKKAVSSQRTEIVQLKRRLQQVEKLLARLAKSGPIAVKKASVDSEGGTEDASGIRFSAKGLASNRKRLGLSAADFGLLVGVSGQSIYGWESGKMRPRPDTVVAIASLRGITKQEVAERLSRLKVDASTA